jgi:hypothetical protein
MRLNLKTKKEVQKMLAKGYVPTKEDIEYIIEVRKLLDANKVVRIYLPKEMSDSEIRSLLSMGELVRIVRPKSKKSQNLTAFFQRPDYRKRLRGLKLAYRLKGRM